jgi:hypothetical protein
VRVLLDGEPGADLRIRISNPYPAPAARPEVPGAGMGLIGVSERAELAGGRVEYGPRGEEFRLEARLPWLV